MRLRSLTGAALEAIAESRVAEKYRQQLLADLSYSVQVNQVIPMLASLLGQPPLPKKIGDLLNTLRKYRNQLAHSGVLTKQISPSQQAELLAAAIVAVRYMCMLKEHASS